MIDQILKELSKITGKEVLLTGKSSVGGGCIHNATRLDTTAGIYFLKWNQSCASDIFVREAESLRELKKGNPEPLIIPDVILVKEVDDTPGYLLLEFLESGNTHNGDEELGRGLANLHRFRGEKFGFRSANYCGLTLQDNKWQNEWPQFFAEQRIGALVSQIRKERGMPAEHTKIYEKLIGKIPSLLPDLSIPALIHGDLWSGNYMMTQRGPALIDPAAYYADREMEMGIMTMFGGFSARFWSAYNEAYPLPSDWRLRNRLYQLYHILNHYLLFGRSYGQSAIETAKYYLYG
jgi:protein-ribulosamine 3-kinase